MAKLHIPTTCAVILTTAVAAGQAWGEVLVNDSTEISFATFVPCANNGAGEVISLTGPLHILITYTINGNVVRGRSHFQPQGLSGVGLSTGETYRGVGVTQSEFSGSMQNGQFNQTYVNNFKIIGRGPGNNFSLHENYHVTVNANGQLTSYHDNFSSDCK